MNEERMLKPALIGGILLGVLSSLPYLNFPCCCCVWIIGGGVLAAYVYVKESAVPVTLGRGAALGLFCGVIGAMVSALFMAPAYLINKTGIADQVMRNIDQMPSIPEETRQMVSSILAREGMAGLLIVLTFLFMIVCYCILAMLGGTIGVAVFEKRTRETGAQSAADIEPPSSIPPPPPE